MEFGSFMEFHSRVDETQSEAFAESFRHVKQAEDMGLDSVWLAEGHFNAARSVLSSPHIIAAAIAAKTQRIGIGTSVSVLPLGNPLRTAEEIATIDHVSQGRFEFGVGRSGFPGSYEGYNIPYTESSERFYEALNIILRAWTTDTFSYEGKFHTFRDVTLVPKPLQQPFPKVRVAASTTDTFPKIAKLGLPIFVGLRSSNLAEVSKQIELYRSEWGKHQHKTPMDISLRVPVYVASSAQKATSESEESFMRQFKRLGGQFTASVDAEGSENITVRSNRGTILGDLKWADVIGHKAVVGTPDMVTEQILKMKEALHLTSLIAEFNAGELIPEDKIRNSVNLFCTEVIPQFR